MRNLPYETISRLLIERRHSLGLSPADVARRAGIGQSIISRIEAGKKIPTPETLAALSPALELSLSDLYEAAGYPVPQLPSLRPYLRRNYGVSEHAVDEIERYLERLGAEYGTASQPFDGEDELPE